MKKTITTLVFISISGLAFSQVGINTENPLGTFHVDTAKDNPATGTPTAAQAANDVVVSSTGNLGLGTVSPINKFHSVATTATQGAYNLFDATAGVGANSASIVRLRNTSTATIGNIATLGFSNNGPTSGGPGWQVGSIRARADIASGDDFFFSNSTGGTQVERMRITADNGNVGSLFPIH